MVTNDRSKRTDATPNGSNVPTRSGNAPTTSEPQHFRERMLLLVSVLATVAWIIWIFSFREPTHEVVAHVRPVTWLISLAIVSAFMLGIGHHVTGHWRSLLIDDRHKISLSRMQLVLWTILVLSAFANALVWNLAQDACITEGTEEALSFNTEVTSSDTAATNSNNQATNSNSPKPCEPLNLTIPNDLLLLMGISTGALIGAKAIKADQMSDKKLHVNHHHHEADWTDIFRTEGKHDFHSLDLGKLQMFLFTVILVLGYAGVIWTDFSEIHNFDFPAFSIAAVGLLGISQIGYLVTKAVQTQSSGSNAETPTPPAGSGGSSGSAPDDTRAAAV
jgi:hypothetical protein